MESPAVRRNLKRKCSDVTRSETSESKEISLRRKLPNTRMQKTPSDQNKTPTTSRISNTTPKKKSSANRGLKGQKWFKGTPKSRTSHRMRPSQKLLKSSPQDNAPQAAPLPPSVVEFEFDGVAERLFVFDVLEVGAHEVSELQAGTSRESISKDGNSAPISNTPVQHHLTWSSSMEKKSRSNGNNSTKGKSSFKSKIRSSKKLDQLMKQRNGTSVDGQDPNANPPKLPEAKFRLLKDFKMTEAPHRPNAYIRYIERPIEELAEEVEYDLDEEDCAWLELVNAKRRSEKFSAVPPESIELLMDRLEKESYFQMQSTGMDQGPLIDDDAVCCICMDGECQNSNAILFCDMCNLAVHQECYGVPYIPEGQWLCRRCLQSPSRAVDCALCPNKGGAFKQTDDGRWAHVVCAIWIPEVCFANTVFLEPIDSIGNIPAARWRLSCYVCKQKGVGACIQCHKSNCYTAFHVTCAQQADLCMKMDTVREGSSVIVKKTAYCDNHAPLEVDSPSKDSDGTQSPRQKMRQTRKLLAEKRCAIPVVSIPTIPNERIDQISLNVNFRKKQQFVKRLMSYWKLKRLSRNGVPLLRRLQAASVAPRSTTVDASSKPIDPSAVAANQAYYQYFMRLRQDLERARLLCELIRKREKIKRELIHLHDKELNLKLKPFTLFLLKVVDEIASKDSLQIFAKPVNAAEVPDYLTVVKQPMDLSTMKEKVNSFQYRSVEDLEADFNLMIENCLLYNSKDTIFHRAGVKLKELGGIIIRHAKREFLTIGYDPSTGLHLLDQPTVPEVLTDGDIVKEVEDVLDDKERFSLEQDKHITLLEDILDKTLSLTHPVTKKNRYARIKNEICRVKRLYEQKEATAAAQKTQASPKITVRKRIIKKLGRKPANESPSTSESLPKGKSAYDFELSDEFENSNSPCVSSEAWRKRFPNPKSSPTAKSGGPVQNHVTPSKIKDKGKSTSTDSSPNSNKRALRPPKQKTPPVSSPSPTSVSPRVSNNSPKRIVERKSPVRKNLLVSQFVGTVTGNNKLVEKINSITINKSPNVGKMTAKPKSTNEASNLSQYSRREQKEMRAKEMTHQKVSISMALAAAQQITFRENGDLKDRSAAKCKSLTSLSQTGVNRNIAVLTNKYKRPKLACVSAKKYKKSTNGVSNNMHVNNNCKSSVTNRADSTNKTPPSPARRNLTRKQNTGADHVSEKNTAKHNSSNNNTITNNVHYTSTNNRSSPSSINQQKLMSPYNNSANSVSNNYSSSPTRSVANNTTPRRRKTNTGKSIINPADCVVDLSRDKPNVDKSDSFMVYRSGGTNEMDSNSEDDDKNNDEDEEEIDEEEDSMEDSVEESEDEEEPEVSAEERSPPPTNNEMIVLSESESSEVTSGLSSKSSSSGENSSANSESDSSSSSESDCSSGEEVAAQPAPKQVNKVSTSTKPIVSNNVKKIKTSVPGGSHKPPIARHYDRPVYSPDVTAPVSAQISYRKRVEEYERLKAGKGILSKCLDHKNCSKVIYEDGEEEEEDSSGAESDRSSDICCSKMQDKSKTEPEDCIIIEPLEKKVNTLSIALQPLDLVWARCKEGYSYPALIINPEMPVGFTQNGVAIPGPPREILEKRPRFSNPTEQVFLVLFFDHKRSWEWITRSKLQQLGMDPSLDKERLMEIRKPSEKKAVRRAYENAILHRCRVNGSTTVIVDNLGD